MTDKTIEDVVAAVVRRWRDKYDKAPDFFEKLVVQSMETSLNKAIEDLAIQQLSEKYGSGITVLTARILDVWINRGDIEIPAPNDKNKKTIEAAMHDATSKQYLLQSATKKRKKVAFRMQQQGKTIKEISDRLCLSQSTISGILKLAKAEVRGLQSEIDEYLGDSNGP